MAQAERPLSPHLFIYKPQLTSVLSISHRMTGMAATVGTLLLAYWLIAAALGPAAYGDAQALMGSWIGIVFMIGWTFSLIYHLCNGVRHMCWDAGWGYGLKAVYASGWAMLATAVGLTAVVCVIGLSL